MNQPFKLAGFIMFFLAISASAWAKIVTETPICILEMDEHPWSNPSWSPDQRYIAVTRRDYQGLWVFNYQSGELRLINSEPGGGYGYSWSPDSRQILARVSRYDGVRRLQSVKLIAIEGSQREWQLTEYLPHLRTLPFWAPATQSVYLYQSERFQLIYGENPVTKTTLCQTSGQNLLLARSVEQQPSQLAPYPDQEYLNLCLSPNGADIAFEVYGGNLHIMSLDGAMLIDLGPGNRPRWSPDGNWLVYMVTRDDGHQFMESDLYCSSRDGKIHFALTETADYMEMNPDWSPDGRYIVFDDYLNGSVYLLPLTYTDSK